MFLVEEAPEGGFTARALGASIFTEADNLPDLRAQIRDAISCHFEEKQDPNVPLQKCLVGKSRRKRYNRA